MRTVFSSSRVPPSRSTASKSSLLSSKSMSTNKRRKPKPLQRTWVSKRPRCKRKMPRPMSKLRPVRKSLLTPISKRHLPSPNLVKLNLWLSKPCLLWSHYRKRISKRQRILLSHMTMLLLCLCLLFVLSQVWEMNLVTSTSLLRLTLKAYLSKSPGQPVKRWWRNQITSRIL